MGLPPSRVSRRKEAPGAFVRSLSLKTCGVAVVVWPGSASGTAFESMAVRTDPNGPYEWDNRFMAGAFNP